MHKLWEYGYNQFPHVFQKYYNFTLPDWIPPVYERAANFSLFYFEYLSYTLEMKRLHVGPLLEKLVGNMNESAAALQSQGSTITNGQKKINLFSGHDTTLTGLLDTLGIYDKKRPAFAAAIFLELHQNKTVSEEMYVEVREITGRVHRQSALLF